EERQRGSLDVLLATPLSTRSIVLGKWWGTFRLVPLLAICPGLMALAMATADISAWIARMPANSRSFYDTMTLGQRLYGALLLVATILAHGAATTSVGLALATWLRRPSRAIALSVGLFVLVSVAWPFLIIGIARGDGGPGAPASGLAALSPIWTAGTLADMLTIRSKNWSQFPRWVTCWDVVVALFAIGLLELTVRTFDACF